MSSETEIERYEFAFDRLARPLSLLGIRPDACYVLVTESRLEVRFGPWTVRTPLDNVEGAEVSGPFKSWKAVGVRLSLADRGLTFGSSIGQGVCIRFRRPVRGSEPTGRLRHPNLTVTVADAPTLARRLQDVVAARR
ncbi:hypothetical protein E1293_32525 [Actinomadura darangshiensis]|uniref:Uncharacterized protein n=1 Tax=Actinomadura darangshiensis TaxID=705336 RepID=A0A4R5AM81_9ACTN|nr:hypothetical protein [Actinomadura darangshiensis]TDD72780.1 hypothetical protein E1293_32525 [Actinomadura darangshiensis]